MHLLFAEDQPQLRRSAREYALLEYLIRNKGIILSREQIENNLWNYDYAGGHQRGGRIHQLSAQKAGRRPREKTAAHGPGHGLGAEGGRMRHISIKVRMTIWFTVVMVVISSLMLVFVMLMNRNQVTKPPAAQVVSVVTRNADRLERSSRWSVNLPPTPPTSCGRRWR